MAVAAEALGVTTKEFIKMMEQGKILAKDFWPKFFKQMRKITDPSLQKAMQSFAAGQERMMNTFDRLKNTLFTRGFEDVFVSIMDSITSLMTALDRVVDSGLGKALEGIVKGFIFLPQLVMFAADDLTFWISKWTGTSKDQINDLRDTIIEFTFKVVGLIAAFKLLSKFTRFGKRGPRDGDDRDSAAASSKSSSGRIFKSLPFVATAAVVAEEFVRTGGVEDFKQAVSTTKTGGLAPRMGRRSRPPEMPMEQPKVKVEVEVKNDNLKDLIDIQIKEAEDELARSVSDSLLSTGGK